MVTRSQRRGGYAVPAKPPRHAEGDRHGAEHTFAFGASRALNAVSDSHEAIFAHLPEGPPRSGGSPGDAGRGGAAPLIPHNPGGPRHAKGGAVWIDGGCAGHGKQRTRVAGYGVHYGDDDERNESGPVAGAQTVKRAETEALARVLEGSAAPSLSIRTDSREVSRGFKQHRGWYARAWMRRPLRADPVPHADQWRRIHREVQRREESGLTTDVMWVPSQSGKSPHTTTPEDAAGNRGAHALASAARQQEAARRGATGRRPARSGAAPPGETRDAVPRPGAAPARVATRAAKAADPPAGAAGAPAPRAGLTPRQQRARRREECRG